MIGEEPQRWKILMEERAIERVVATRAQLGQALRALQIAANYAEHRKTFGKRLRGARPSRDPMPERAAQKV